MTYISPRLAPRPDVIYVCGTTKKEIERLVGHKVIAKQVGYDWDYLIRVEDAIKICVLSEESAENRHFRMTGEFKNFNQKKEEVKE